MLRVEMHDSGNVLMVRLESQFAGSRAEQVRMLMTRCHTEMRLVVDLTEVTFIDGVGEEVLSSLAKLGAEFVADTSYTLDVCERLPLRLRRRNFHSRAEMRCARMALQRVERVVVPPRILKGGNL